VITILGGNGNTGRRIAAALLQAGEKVRVHGRSADKLAALERDGAEVALGDATDAASLTRAFRGADAVYTLVPPSFTTPDYRAWQDRVGEATVEAIRASGVRYVVFLSSLGADQPSGTGPIAGLHAQEERLRRLPDTHVLALRAGYFFENFYANLDLVRKQGVNGGALAPDVPMAMIATRDIAAAAAQALRTRDWQGFAVRELLGPRDLTQREATRLLGERIGKPGLEYVQFPYSDFAGALVQMGLSPSLANLYAEMSRAFNEGRVKSLEGRRPTNTTPTRFEDFAAELARAYGAG
jgi:uncharacterized protein YbjT (DUF2867 family)